MALEICIKRRLIPEPSAVELKSIVPGQSPFARHHSCQHKPSRYRKQLRQFLQEEAAFGSSQVAGTAGRLKSRDVSPNEFRKDWRCLLPGTGVDELYRGFLSHRF